MRLNFLTSITWHLFCRGKIEICSTEVTVIVCSLLLCLMCHLLLRLELLLEPRDAVGDALLLARVGGELQLQLAVVERPLVLPCVLTAKDQIVDDRLLPPVVLH